MQMVQFFKNINRSMEPLFNQPIIQEPRIPLCFEPKIVDNSLFIPEFFIHFIRLSLVIKIIIRPKGLNPLSTCDNNLKSKTFLNTLFIKCALQFNRL